jgi:ABC-type dipeptide/oligopeptide/nickel transport system ATPase component
LLEVRDLKICFAADDGPVKALDGVSFTLDLGPDAGHRRRAGVG